SDFPTVGSVVSYFSPVGAMPASVTIPRPMSFEGSIWAGTYAGFLGPRHDPMESRESLTASGHTSHAVTMPQGVDSARLIAQRGLLDETMVVVTGEFGRTPKINQDQGREHWGACYSAVLAGGGVGGGQVYGASDKIAAYPKDNPVAPEDLLATIYEAMGIPSA